MKFNGFTQQIRLLIIAYHFFIVLFICEQIAKCINILTNKNICTYEF